MQRLQYIDRLKGIAILSVVMYQIILGPLHYKWYDAQGDWLVFLFYSYQMPLFMFLSGLVISSGLNLQKCVEKFFKFMMPCLLFGVVKSSLYDESAFSFIFQDIKGGYWYLWVLSIFYILLTITNHIFKYTRTSWVLDLCTALCIYVMFKLLFVFLQNTISDFLSLARLIEMWPFFIMGFLFQKYDIVKYLVEKNYIYTLFLVTLPIFLFIYGKHYLTHGVQLLSVSFIGTYMFLFIRRENNHTYIEDLLSSIGRHSLDVYIFHFFLLNLVSLPFWGQWFLQTKNFLLEMLVILPLAIIISIFCIIIGKILRQSSLIRKIFYGDISHYLQHRR